MEERVGKGVQSGVDVNIGDGTDVGVEVSIPGEIVSAGNRFGGSVRLGRMVAGGGGFDEQAASKRTNSIV